MTFLLILSIIILLFYLAIILFAVYNLSKPFLFSERDNIKSGNTYTLIVPFRNELENLKNIYSDLLDLKFDRHRYEVILINDHSSDGSFEWLNKCDMPDNFRLLTSLKEGKKQALIKAISLSSGNYIVTTDADCRLQPFWLNTIDETIGLRSPKLLVQPVITMNSNNLISQFQYYDSLSLLGINMAAYNIQKYPLLASGANLVFQKEAFNKIEPFSNNVQIASGDDMFILTTFIKNDSKSIFINYTPQSLVITKAESSWINLINQRRRWVGKMKRFNNTSSYLLGLFSVIVQLVLIELLLIGVLYLNYFLMLFVFVWLVKSYVDYLFFKRIAERIGHSVNWLNVWFLEPIYMIFVPLVTVFSIFYSPKWKGRKIIE